MVSETQTTAPLSRRFPQGFPRLFNFIGLLIAYTRLNLNAQLEYRAAFISQVVAMFLNDGTWVLFWVVFFTRFQVLHGWGVNDVITIWAITASSFGLAFAIFGNALGLAGLIAKGQLDAWMLYPRAVLPHMLMGRMSATAWGDALFGFFTYILFVRPDVAHLLLFTALVLSVTITFVGFGVLTGSLSFYLGNAAPLADQWFFSVITFSTYPSVMFDGAIKLILFTVIPAGFVSYLPNEALRGFSLEYAALTLLGSLAVLSASVLIFYRGLRRYESGNLMEMRG